MKNIFILFMTIIGLVSCGNANEENVLTNNTPSEIQVATKNPSPTKKADTNNILCQINGKDWAYTKASGIISRHARTKLLTAFMTFTKKLEKGSESVQLRYHAETFELISVSLILKSPKKGGGLITSYYSLNEGNKRLKPRSELSGTIDLSNLTHASGVAEIKNLNIDYEKEKLTNPEDAMLDITNLNFKNIGYSDIDKFAKAHKK